MSLRVTAVCLRSPLIRFTYAAAKSGVSAPSAAASVRAGSAAYATQQAARQPEARTLFERVNDLPANLRPKPMSEEEIETVMMGGAAPYVPKHLQKKRK